MYTLNTVEQHGVAVIENHPNDSRVKIKDDGIVQALTSNMGIGGGNTPMVMETHAEAVDVRKGTTNGTTNGTLQRCASNNLNGNNVVMEGSFQNTGKGYWKQSETGATVRTPAGGGSMEANLIQEANASSHLHSVVRRITPLEAERLQGFPDNYTRIGTPKTFTVNDYVYGFDYVKFEQIKPDINDYVPLEKQGKYELPQPPSEADLLDEDYFDDDDPDYESVYDDDEDWIAYRKAYDEAHKKSEKRVKVGSHTEEGYEWVDDDGKKHRLADSSRYKAMGNSIAVGFANNRSGFWMWLMRRISAQYERTPTLGSLFAGVGGFDLSWESINGTGTSLWSSEIEPFCVAVLRQRFGDDEKGTKGDWREFV